MKDSVFQNEFGDVMDIIFYPSATSFKKVCSERIRCFCFIEPINDYAYVFCPTVKFLRLKSRKKYDKSNKKERQQIES